ncbi:MAG TPA: cupredoxin domain-containing protein [Nitrososphaera sp.]|nr:cupredoxin domain-containing protein [Nitrososphaera sp.]
MAEGSNKLGTVGLGIAIASIITSGIALAMQAGLNARIDALSSTTNVPTQQKAMEVGAPGNDPNEFWIFTQELMADEEKLGIPVAVYTLTEITVHKGDNVTIHFYNPAEEADDRHTFTMQVPYQMSYDLAGGENKTFSFTADTVGRFTYYCTYDLPSMIGQLEVLP